MIRKTGVLLCRCENQIAEKLYFSKISEWLKKNHPTTIIKISDNLCKRPNEIGAFVKRNNIANVVVGACRKYRELFEDTAERGGLNPFYMKIIGLLERCFLVHKNEAHEKAKILLSAAILREQNLRIPQENLKLAATRLNGKMNRRAFLTFLVKRRARVIPTIASGLCVKRQGCNFCVEACPTHALREGEEKIRVDTTKCESCGICATICPKEAIFFPLYTLGQITKELKSLISLNSDFLKPRVVLFACEGGASFLDRLAYEGFSYNPNLMVVEVPCIGIITPLVILKTLALGAEGTALIPCQSRCRLGYNLKNMHENLQASKRLLEILKTSSERICVISPSTDLREFHTQLQAYSQNIARLGSHPLCFEKFSEAEDSWQSLPFLLKRIVDKLKLDKDFKVHSSELPFGVVEVKTDVCSMCGLCARHCPSNALSFDMNSEEAKLVFNYNLCMVCGICLEICPSEALRITKMLDLKWLTVPLAVLVKDKMVKCRSCGVAFQPSKQVRYISSKVSIKEKYLKLVSEYCPDCRGRRLPPTFDAGMTAQ